MSGSRGKRHLWRQVKAIASLPVTIPLWFIGWALYCVGDQGTLPSVTKKKAVTTFEKEDCESNNTRESAPKQILT